VSANIDQKDFGLNPWSQYALITFHILIEPGLITVAGEWTMLNFDHHFEIPI
jgi:hypothetical protein